MENQTSPKKNNRNTILGLALIIAPMVAFLGANILYIFIKFAVAFYGGISFVVYNIITTILGFVGMLGMAGMVIGVPLGIYFLLKK